MRNSGTEAVKRVLEGGYCVGCGGCVHAAPGAFARSFGEDGVYRPVVSASAAEAEMARASRACPFTGEGEDEDAISDRLFPDLPRHPAIGRHRGSFAGHVAQQGFRQSGSSGGFVSWVASRLLESGAVDAVLHVIPAEGERGAPIFRYAVSRTVDEVRRGAKSRYYPVELSGVLAEVGRHPGMRFAFVGLPCFVKALHRAAAADETLAQAVGATIAIFCGHLKSARFGDYLAWQGGIAPGELQRIDFRHKLMDRKASSYGFAAEGRDGRRVVRAMAETDGGDWGLGYFKLKACDYCDDVVGETADVSVGDAWLPQYVDDPLGTNVIVARSAAMAELLARGIADGELALEEIGADMVAQSQDAGLRHRRQGLAWRLHKAERQGVWVPPKRVKAAVLIPPKRQRELDLREQLAAESHIAFAEAAAAGDIALFRRRMDPLVRLYHASRHYSLKTRLRSALRRLVRAALPPRS